MNKIMVLFLTCALGSSCYAQQFNETITRELQFEKKSGANVVMIANINGDVTVEGYGGDKILVTVKKEIIAKTDSRLEKGKKDIQLGVIDLADTLILYVEGTCSEFTNKSQRYHRNKREGKGWNYDWSSWGNNCKEEFKFLMHFTVKVPTSVNLAVSTINDGEIVVENMKGSVYADNINGGIKLKQIAGETNVSSINGDVSLDYESNPSGPCKFYSLNGDINANFKKGLGASVSFESFNGNFFTNVDKIESLPVAVEKNSRKDGIEYRLTGNRYKVGSGGVVLDFETFNGDVYLKEL